MPGKPPETGLGGGTKDRERMPLWVKVFALVGALVLLGFALLHFTGMAPTGHGP